MRDYKEEFKRRVAFIKNIVAESGVNGIVFGNSGGKDSALVGILCKSACDNTVGVVMPCSSRRNFGEDLIDAREFADKFKIETRVVDLTPVKEAKVPVYYIDGMGRPEDVLERLASKINISE